MMNYEKPELINLNDDSFWESIAQGNPCFLGNLPTILCTAGGSYTTCSEGICATLGLNCNTGTSHNHCT
jgi:hypothetical protein